MNVSQGSRGSYNYFITVHFSNNEDGKEEAYYVNLYAQDFQIPGRTLHIQAQQEIYLGQSSPHVQFWVKEQEALPQLIYKDNPPRIIEDVATSYMGDPNDEFILENIILEKILIPLMECEDIQEHLTKWEMEIAL